MMIALIVLVVIETIVIAYLGAQVLIMYRTSDSRLDALTEQNIRLRDERDKYRGMLDIPTVVRQEAVELMNDFAIREFLGKDVD